MGQVEEIRLKLLIDKAEPFEVVYCSTLMPRTAMNANHNAARDIASIHAKRRMGMITKPLLNYGSLQRCGCECEEYSQSTGQAPLQLLMLLRVVTRKHRSRELLIAEGADVNAKNGGSDSFALRRLMGR